jgi:AcrR family transcriptional regulator
MSKSNRTQARRQQVLEAAVECFRANGFHGTSMAQLARAAGMSPGHIYNLFENKEEVIRAIVVRDQNDWLQLIKEIESAPNVAQAILDEIDNGVERSTASACAALRLEVLAEAGRNPLLAAVVQDADATRRQCIEVLLRAAQKQLGLDADSESLQARAAALATIFDGLIVRAVRDPDMDRKALAQVVRLLTRTLLKM